MGYNPVLCAHVKVIAVTTQNGITLCSRVSQPLYFLVRASISRIYLTSVAIGGTPKHGAELRIDRSQSAVNTVSRPRRQRGAANFGKQHMRFSLIDREALVYGPSLGREFGISFVCLRHSHDYGQTS